MTAEQRKAVFTSIIQGGTRKALRGEKPFQPLSENDPKVKVFREKVSALAPRIGVDFDAIAEPVVLAEIA